MNGRIEVALPKNSNTLRRGAYHTARPAPIPMLDHSNDSLGAAFVYQTPELRWLQTSPEGRQSQMMRKSPATLVPVGLRACAFSLAFGVPDSTLFLGVGCGDWIRFFRHHWPENLLIGVEYRPMLLALGREFFSLPSTDAHLKLVVTDANEYVRLPAGGKVEMVLVDLFNGISPAPFLAEMDFWRGVLDCLLPGGRVVVNLAGPEEFVSRVRAAIAQVFPHSGWIPSGEGVINQVGLCFHPEAAHPDPEVLRQLASLITRQTGVPVLQTLNRWLERVLL